MINPTVLKHVLDLAVVKLPEEQITEETSLTSDLGYDSMLFVELIVNLEIEFDITIDDEDLDINLFLNFGNLNEYVNGKIGNSASKSA